MNAGIGVERVARFFNRSYESKSAQSDEEICRVFISDNISWL